MRKKSRLRVIIQIMILCILSTATLAGFALEEDCDEPPPDEDPCCPPGGGTGGQPRIWVDPFDAVCVGGSRTINVHVEGGAAGLLTLEPRSGDASFYTAGGTKELEVRSALTVPIYGERASDSIDAISLKIQFFDSLGGLVTGYEDFSVILLTRLAVSGATPRSQGNCYVATASSGDVVVEAKFSPDLSFSIDQGIISWTGGQAATGSPLRRVVRTASPAVTTVSASCGSSSQSATIAVVEACGANASVQPVYINTGAVPILGNDFGRTVFPDVVSEAIDIDARACFDPMASLWRIRVNTITYKYLQSVSTQGKISVLSSYDSVVTTSTYCAILDDFTPGGGNPPRAPYGTYVSCCGGCIQAHEDQHVLEWKDAFDDAWDDPDVGEAKLEALTLTFVCGSRDSAEEARNAFQPWIVDALNDTITRAISKWPGLDPPQGNSQAYWVEGGCLEFFNEAILLRAHNANWPPCH
jgi:hypothetical protein